MGSMTDITRSHPARPDADRHGIVVRAAWLYYKDALTQAEIADRLFVSRATVGRLLEEARAEGIVRIEISADHLAAFQLSEDLRAQYGLADAVVVPRISGDATRERANGRVASAAAEYVKRFLRPGAIIGIAGIPQPDGSIEAFSIHIFLPAQRGVVPDRRGPWDARPNSTMTNGYVENAVASKDGETLMVKYKDGEKKVVVPPGTPIVTFLVGDKSELKPGAKIIIFGATRKDDGTLEANRVNVGRDGITPPM